MTAKRNPRYIAYTRFSTKEQGKEGRDSTRRQQELAEAWARAKGVEIDQSLTDAGIPSLHGQNTAAGTGLAAFFAAIEQGLVRSGDFLLLEKIDRLSRMAPFDAFELIQRIVTKGITVVTCSDGQEYTREALNKDFGRFQMLLGAIQLAHMESRNKSERITASWERKRRDAEQGIRRPHKHPAWLRYNAEKREYEPIPEAAKAVQRIFELCLEGKGTRAILQALRAEQVPCFGTCDTWRGPYVEKILRSRNVVGEIAFEKTEIREGRKVQVPLGNPVTGYYPQIISTADFNRVQALRSEKSFWDKGAGPDSGTNIFTGRAFCASCGGTMHIVQAQKVKAAGHRTKYEYFKCAERKGSLACDMALSFPRPLAEYMVLRSLTKEVRAELMAHDSGTASRMAEALQEIQNLEAEHSRIEEQVSTLNLRMSHPDFPADNLPDVLKLIGKLTARRKELAAQIQQQSRDMEQAHAAGSMVGEALGTIRNALALETPEERQKVRLAIASIVRRITMDTRPELKRITIEFKTGLTYTTDEGQATGAYPRGFEPVSKGQRRTPKV